jgi:hypothetical protein
MDNEVNQAEPATATRRRRSPLDSYVEGVILWVSARPDGVSAVGLTSMIAREFNWPVPFAEAILTSVKARRLLRVHRVGSRSLNLAPSRRADLWLAERSEAN